MLSSSVADSSDHPRVDLSKPTTPSGSTARDVAAPIRLSSQTTIYSMKAISVHQSRSPSLVRDKTRTRPLWPGTCGKGEGIWVLEAVGLGRNAPSSTPIYACSPNLDLPRSPAPPLFAGSDRATSGCRLQW